MKSMVVILLSFLVLLGNNVFAGNEKTKPEEKLSKEEVIQKHTEMLLKKTASSDADVAAEAFKELISLRKKAIPTCMKALIKSKKTNVRVCSATLLGMFGSKSVIKILSEGLRKDADPIVRVACANALGKIGHSSAVPVLVEQLKRKAKDKVENAVEKSIRSQVAAALGRIKDKAAVVPLIESLNDPVVAIWASTALKEITEQDFGLSQKKWRNWQRGLPVSEEDNDYHKKKKILEVEVDTEGIISIDGRKVDEKQLLTLLKKFDPRDSTVRIRCKSGKDISKMKITKILEIAANAGVWDIDVCLVTEREGKTEYK